MRVQSTAIAGALLIELDVHSDNRGFFLESYQSKRYAEFGIDHVFVQDNHSCSEKGVVRGIHYQIEHPIGHLIYVTKGHILDVGVDLRPASPTFGRHISFELSAEMHQQLFLPPGVAHGFSGLGEWNEIWYKCTDFYYPEDEAGLLWNDPDLGIDWLINSPNIKVGDIFFPRLRDIHPSRLPRI
ncbi:dTDP-4-dehydrorhamnose 3,5-epimerase [Polynucleobacter sp. MWH-Braz-FAM2G]|uniref:dTDP-4-dehydrorhamnose 3,5-epimerase n=1 Tax=Polynucleobacter sp. MWH-Braz-FAM2G TaxID=1855883 RepID=UPI001BFE8307|nr:dTDP-4-dehydrorhamnose 3,5-epimerase [Polynucleobacter sp. MWH-Braz-FAM2G]QWD91085.1 dTDP-4-dehydrorhamnose 3,5-epimerase [Polynucleobacter sp. MWH-Braz-FAM2G]